MSERNGVKCEKKVKEASSKGGVGKVDSRRNTVEILREFEKWPTVVIERAALPPNAAPKTRPILKKTSQHDNGFFSKKCSVFIVRDDLSKLKNSLKASKVPNGLDLKRNMSLSCRICKKIYESEKKLMNHQQNKHIILKPLETKTQKRVSFSDNVIVHEVKYYHKCRKCPKIFEDYKLLKTHMKEQHKKRKCYICNYCAKKFVDRMFFKVHIKLHCEVCGHLATTKTKLIEHKRNVCKVVKLHKCKTCNIAFFKFMDLKDHSYEHITTCYVCDICKDQFLSKCSVAHHIYFLHSKRHLRRTPSLYKKRKLGMESLYLCKFCEESSVDRDIIESHVQKLPDLNNRAMTGYKDYYFCDQCLKKFDTEKDMLQHKWSHFLKTSDNSQVRKTSLLEQLLTKETKLPADIKRFYNVNEKIPNHFQPKVLLEKLKMGGIVVTDTETIPFVDVNSFDVFKGEIKKPIVDPKSKKTIISKHQCQTCGKYYSSNYCLNRHIETQHCDFENLRCKVCEEVFVWPSLLQRHKCIRLNIPEMPFEDARPEIHFENLEPVVNIDTEIGFDDLNIEVDDDLMQSVDFEIPAPIVELNEYENTIVTNNIDMSNQMHQDFDKTPFQNLGYKIVMQEVPIEF